MEFSGISNIVRFFFVISKIITCYRSGSVGVNGFLALFTPSPRMYLINEQSFAPSEVIFNHLVMYYKELCSAHAAF